MGTVIIFLLITILAGIGAIRSLKDKNILGVLFAGGSFLVFGWFSVMTILTQWLSCLNKDKKKHRSGCFFFFLDH